MAFSTTIRGKQIAWAIRYFVWSTSAAASENLTPALLAMLGTFRAANMQHDITGMFLYHNSDFMQLLEGSEKDVLASLKNIESCVRHDSVTVVMRESISERHFTHWSMAFRDLAVPSWTSSPGYSEFLNMPFHAIPFWRTPDKCQELMLNFRAELL